MRHRHRQLRIATLVLAVVTVAAVAAAELDDSDSASARKAAWQQGLETSRFTFRREVASVLHSLSLLTRVDCQVVMTYDPKLWYALEFNFVHGGKTFASLAGNTHSAFCGDNARLFFARNPEDDCGCTVLAYDIADGKKLWESRLQAVGDVDHSAYRNEVTISVSTDAFGKDAVVVTGQESYGDYVEVLDAATGMTLAHKIYRQGF